MTPRSSPPTHQLHNLASSPFFREMLMIAQSLMRRSVKRHRDVTADSTDPPSRYHSQTSFFYSLAEIPIPISPQDSPDPICSDLIITTREYSIENPTNPSFSLHFTIPFLPGKDRPKTKNLASLLSVKIYAVPPGERPLTLKNASSGAPPHE